MRDLVKVEKKLNKLIKRTFGIKARLGSDFIADFEEKHIEYTLIATESSDMLFLQNIEDKYPNAPFFDLFTWSILHEVGHFKTEKEVEDWGFEKKNRLQYRMTFAKNLSEKSKIFKEYFEINCEYLATEWAIIFVQKRIKKAIKFNEKAKKIIFKFYGETLDGWNGM